MPLRAPILAAAALSVVAAASASAALPRATTDRPDDVQGPQIHIVYAVPEDLADRRLDTNGVIDASVANWEGWLRTQTGGRELRLDTYQGQPDITFFRLPETDAQISARGPFVRDEVQAQLRAAGLVSAGKLYAVYYDGTSTFSCGGGAWPPTLPGVVGALYLRSVQPGFPCYDPTKSPAGLQLMDLAILHELMHTMGFVPTCAPHFTRAGHVSDDYHDLMWAGDSPPYWDPTTLDVGHDDYYDAHIPGCPDFADSPYLTSTSFRLTVTIAGRGSVVSTPAGIQCTHSCSAAFTQGVLRATPAKGWRFTGWSGACSGRSSCSLALTADATVVVTFRRR
jgi:hypothetical protein